MYESFYELKEKPFTLLPDPEYLYLSPKHQRALTLLEYGLVNQAGFSVICGDTGAGKTTLIRHLLTELGNETVVGLITNTHQSFGELLNWVLMAFGLDGENKSKSQMHHMFVQFLIEQYAHNKYTVLIVDEAQNMQVDTLEELRMLSNINVDKDQVLQVILAGQPSLRETLRKPELTQFAQRIAVDYYLESLSHDETLHYINHRLSVAGAKNMIFTDDACDAIYQFSGGIPRVINLLCDTSMVYGFADQLKTINGALVKEVVAEQSKHSSVPVFDIKMEPSQASSETSKASEVIEDDKIISTMEVKESIDAEKNLRSQQAVSGLDTSIGMNLFADQARSLATHELLKPQLQPGPSAPGPSAPSSSTEVNMAKLEALDVPVNTTSAMDTKVTPISQNITVDSSSRSSEDEINDKNPDDKASEDIVFDEEVMEPELTESMEDCHPAGDGDELENIPFREDLTIETLAGSEHAEESIVNEQQHFDKTYPIIHVEDPSKRNLNYLVVGLGSGMFISMAFLVAATLLVNDGQLFDREKSDQQVVSSQILLNNDKTRLDILQKERDAALALSRALERERDAALAASQLQEQMREAEKRAAELFARQEKRSSIEVRRARQLAKQAEINAAKAEEREKIARQQAKAAMREAERINREKLTSIEQQKQKNSIQQSTSVMQDQQIESRQQTAGVSAAAQARVKLADALSDEAPTHSNSTKTAKPSPGPSAKFSTNPCKSPSAKFLSTCKK